MAIFVVVYGFQSLFFFIHLFIIIKSSFVVLQCLEFLVHSNL